MTLFHDLASFVRWRLVPLRYATMVTGGRWMRPSERFPFRTAISDQINQHGYHAGPTFALEQIKAINDAYRPRAASVKPTDRGAPFTNLFRPEDIHPENPVIQLAFNQLLLDPASDYFGGKLTLDSVQVLYSWPTEGALRESQKWHKDYGDTRSFHCIIYLNDVLTSENGPFVFVDKNDSRRIARMPIVRRIADNRFFKELSSGTARTFFGVEGQSIFVDPAACYHYGSRCRQPRLAIFVTFNSHLPFVPAIDLITDNRERWLAAAQAVRPDLSEKFLRRLLNLENA